jgi:hypothetical protein
MNFKIDIDHLNSFILEVALKNPKMKGEVKIAQAALMRLSNFCAVLDYQHPTPPATVGEKKVNNSETDDNPF